MSWLNALALAGAAFVALPILIHLMGRAPARARRFPSLRFIEASRLLPLRRTRLQDPLLLVIRALTILLAVLALAGPVFGGRSTDATSSLRAVAVVVDTSASAGNRGRAVADSVVAGASASAIVTTARPGAAIAGAAAWLGAQQGTRQLVLVSDFQLGAVDSVDVARVPGNIAVTTRRLPIAQVNVPAGSTIRAQLPFEVIAGATEESNAALVTRVASSAVASLPRGPSRQVALVYSSAPNYAALLGAGEQLAQQWQGEVIARLARDPVLDGVVDVARLSPKADRGGERLLLFVSGDVTSDESLATQAALARALGGPSHAGEAETRTLSDAALAAFAARPVAGSAEVAGAPPASSPATRWLWAAVLVALLLEWRLRRRSQGSPA
jgi:hypothetical protein